MELFVSYARPDWRQVNTLVEKLRHAGIGVWLDSDLVGGQPWWDKILGQLRSCDAVLAAVSRAAVNSQACRLEREYAARLGKPVVPITLESMPAGLFPQDIARVQVIDYSQPSDGSAFKLAGAIFALPKPAPLPSPLPAPPSVPQTRFGDLNDRISTPSLTLEEQLGIVGVLEVAVSLTSDHEDRQTAAEMLSEMAKRPDLYQQAARKIEALQARAGGRARSRQRTPHPLAPSKGNYEDEPGFMDAAGRSDRSIGNRLNYLESEELDERDYEDARPSRSEELARHLDDALRRREEGHYEH
jgi:hypothetical protein